MKNRWDNFMKLDRIEAFCAVARNMSFSKAAEECHVAQSAISQQIRAMEDELGFPLFVRSTRKVSFTDAGQSLYVDCVKLMSGFDEAIDRATTILNGKKRFLTVGIEGFMQCSTKAAVIKHFSDNNPDIEILYKQIDRDKKYEDLLTGKIDLVFDIPQYYTLNQHIKKCGVIKNEHCLMVCKDHPLATRTSVNVKELSEYVTFWGGIPRVEDYVVKSYMEYFREEHIEPGNIVCVPEQDIAAFMVSTGAGGNIVPVSEKEMWNNDAYAFVGLEKPLVLESAWLYSCDNTNQALHRFVEETEI